MTIGPSRYYVDWMKFFNGRYGYKMDFLEKPFMARVNNVLPWKGAGSRGELGWLIIREARGAREAWVQEGQVFMPHQH